MFRRVERRQLSKPGRRCYPLGRGPGGTASVLPPAEWHHNATDHSAKKPLLLLRRSDARALGFRTLLLAIHRTRQTIGLMRWKSRACKQERQPRASPAAAAHSASERQGEHKVRRLTLRQYRNVMASRLSTWTFFALRGSQPIPSTNVRRERFYFIARWKHPANVTHRRCAATDC